MKNKKTISIIICILIVVILIFGIMIGIIKDSKNNVEAPPVLISEDGVNLTMTEEELEEIETSMNKIDDMKIEKDIYVWEINQDATETKISHKTQILLNVGSEDIYVACTPMNSEDLASLDPDDPDYMENYKKLLKKYEIDTKYTFGIDASKFAAKMTNYDILFDIANACGIDAFEGAFLNKEHYDAIYEEYGQKLYYVDKVLDFNYLVADMTKAEYDAITDMTLTFHTQMYDDIEYFKDITLIIFYTKDGKEYRKAVEFYTFLMVG